MKQTFTSNDLLRFIYHEVSSAEEEGIKNCILENLEFANKFHLLNNSVNELNAVQFEPSDTSVRIILEQSKHLLAEESHA